MPNAKSRKPASGRNPRDAIQRREKVLPDVALAGERLAPAPRELVIAAPALAGALDPAPFDQAAVLEAVQRRIERCDVEGDRPARAGGDQLSDLVAVALPLFQQRQDQQLRAAALQLPFELLHGHIS